MTLRKVGTCDKCKEPLYGDEYGPAGHDCPKRKPYPEEILAKLKTWLSQLGGDGKQVGADNSYMRGWYDCYKDISRKLREFEEAHKK